MAGCLLAPSATSAAMIASSWCAPAGCSFLHIDVRPRAGSAAKFPEAGNSVKMAYVRLFLIKKRDKTDEREHNLERDQPAKSI